QGRGRPARPPPPTCRRGGSPGGRGGRSSAGPVDSGLADRDTGCGCDADGAASLAPPFPPFSAGAASWLDGPPSPPVATSDMKSPQMLIMAGSTAAAAEPCDCDCWLPRRGGPAGGPRDALALAGHHGKDIVRLEPGRPGEAVNVALRAAPGGSHLFRRGSRPAPSGHDAMTRPREVVWIFGLLGAVWTVGGCCVAVEGSSRGLRRTWAGAWVTSINIVAGEQKKSNFLYDVSIYSQGPWRSLRFVHPEDWHG
ncbi:hypothetical protein THAOC_25757, partial [Thalassiosira oceanica]